MLDGHREPKLLRRKEKDLVDIVRLAVTRYLRVLLGRRQAEEDHLTFLASQSLVTCALLALSSTPAKRIPSLTAQRAVIPLPQHGSKTSAPGSLTLSSTWRVIATPLIPVGSQPSTPGPEYQTRDGRFGLPYWTTQRALSSSPTPSIAAARSSIQSTPISMKTWPPGRTEDTMTPPSVSRKAGQSSSGLFPAIVWKYVSRPGPHGGSVYTIDASSPLRATRARSRFSAPTTTLSLAHIA